MSRYDSIPPRWLKCPRKGKIIEDKFIPFKTPLSSSYDNQVDDTSRWTVDMLFSSMEQVRPKKKMSLWIDLTNTKRFYKSEDVEKHKCSYIKLQCRGHGECPSADQVKAFISICDKFFFEKPLDVIGVHCTHGFNRTGFLICCYLVQRMDWSLDASIEAFVKSRQPGIYKGDYLAELYALYGDKEDPPPPPPKPDWCIEDDAIDDDGLPINGQSHGGYAQHSSPRPAKKRMRSESAKCDAIFLQEISVRGVDQVCHQPLLGQVQKQVGAMCKFEKPGFPGSQPVSMDPDNLRLLTTKQYMVSWKADGTRYLMLIDGPEHVYMISRDNAIFHISNLKFPRRKAPNEQVIDTLLDGEMIIDKVNGALIPRYLVYDIIKFEGNDVGWTDFRTRLLCIKKEIIMPRHEAMENGRIDKVREPFSVRAKDFYDLSAVKKLLSKEFEQQMSHELDGLIFQPSDQNDIYIAGQCDDTLKWKPAHLNSVDFRLKLVHDNRVGMLAQTRGFLYVGGAKEAFAEIRMTKDLKKLDGKIIECKFDGPAGEWRFMRERTDKSFPNSYRTATSVCKSIRWPVTSEMLYSVIESIKHVQTSNSTSNPSENPVSQDLNASHNNEKDKQLMPPPSLSGNTLNKQ